MGELGREGGLEMPAWWTTVPLTLSIGDRELYLARNISIRLAIGMAAGACPIPDPNRLRPPRLRDE